MARRAGWLFAALLPALVATACAQGPVLRPTGVERTGRPNDRLVCPEGFCRAAADAPAPLLEVAPARLFEAWRAVIEAAPRTTILVADERDLRLVAEQRSRIFGFVDTIAVEILPLGEGRASFAAYSRSETGYWDLGVNAARLGAWIGQVLERLEATRPQR